MYTIGLTGGIGSGKSRVADLLAAWGAAVVDTDEIARTLTAAGGVAIPAIADAFGPAALTHEAALNRAWMREQAFSDTQIRQRLESILHPLITEETVQQAQRARGDYLVLVVPLFVESLARWRARVHRVCVVDCDPETQVARVRARSGLTELAIRRIMAVQATRESRLAVADDVITNDGQTVPEQLSVRTRCLHESWLTQGKTAKSCSMGGGNGGSGLHHKF